MKLALDKKTCRKLSAKTAKITKDSAHTATSFVRENPWIAAGIATTLAVAGGLLALRRRTRHRDTMPTAGEGI